jgi:hypothetical protein
VAKYTPESLYLASLEDALGSIIREIGEILVGQEVAPYSIFRTNAPREHALHE